ncbi:MAG: diguanylate cyclase [Ruminococcus sp.]|nr:diguanylate cyclase [Ruminococcus sp.]
MIYDGENIMENKLMKAAFEVIVNNTSDLVFIKDQDLIYRAASVPFVKMTGKTLMSEVVGHNDSEIFCDQELANRYVSDDKRLLSGGKDLIDYIEPITDDNGNARYGMTSKYILRDSDGKAIGILGITKDVTTEYLARQRYQQELRYLFELPKDTYAVCYIDVDDWRIICQHRRHISEGTLQKSDTVEEVSSYALESIADKKSDASEFYRSFTPQSLHSIYSKGRRTLSFKYERIMTDGSLRWIQNEINFLTDIDSGHLCVMLSARDINEIELEQKKLVEAAKLDAMTMLFNRETSMKSIKSVLKNESDRQHALFMLDIDNFKKLNDTFGHRAGDEFLIKLAAELKSRFRESDIVGRIGGDEFFALMRNVSERVQIERKADDILELIRTLSAEYTDINLGGSIGISIYPKVGRELDELYSRADIALYKAKRNGKNSYVFA